MLERVLPSLYESWYDRWQHHENKCFESLFCKEVFEMLF